MNPHPTTTEVAIGDAELVARSRAGDRDGFGRIVARYQSVVCALAYSACGNVAQSEDIAQEVFLIAWRKLDTLRDPDRLKEWLCGIARYTAVQDYRRNRREPAHHADSLSPATVAVGPSASEQVERREEEAILWRALERLPEIQREALVLYYREHRSIEHVAVALDISEENVRQRLSRGRHALREEITRILEGAISASAPGAAFTAAVVAMLPQATKAGALLEGGTTLKSLAGALITFGGWVAGLFVPLAGLFFHLRTARGTKERQRVLVKWAVLAAGCLAYAAMLYAISAQWVALDRTAAQAAIVLAGAGAYLLAVGFYLQRCIRDNLGPHNEGRRSPATEFRSRTQLFGLPLVHVCFAGNHTPAKGWIAMGPVACGALFACGTFAVAPISCGVISGGLVALGGVAAGGFGFGFVAVGCYALGGFAVGWMSCGGMAVAEHAAQGVVAWARDFALGSAGNTFAAHANTGVARHVIDERFFFRRLQTVLTVCLVAAWLPLVVSLWARRRGARDQNSV